MCGEVGTLSDFAARCGPGQGAAGARGRQTLSIGEYLDGKTDTNFSCRSCSYGLVAIISRVSLFEAALMA